MLTCKVTAVAAGNKHNPLCSEEVILVCSCGWRRSYFCESCPDADGKPQQKTRQAHLGEAIYSHLLRDSR